MEIGDIFGMAAMFFLGYIFGKKNRNTVIENRKINIQMETKDAERELTALEERTQRLIRLADEYNEKIKPSK